jgi:hypothetical protein
LILRRYPILLSLFLSLFLTACGGGDSGASELSEITPVASSFAGDPDIAPVTDSGAAPASGTAGAPSTGVGADGKVGTANWDRQIPVRAKRVMVSAPGELTDPDTEYVLAQDISAPGTAFTIKASNVTLDLNGRTITYGNGSASGPAYGVNVQHNLRDVAIVNGKIRQGSAASETNTAHVGWHGVYFASDVPGFKVAGLSIEYRTPETSAIHAAWGKDGEIHNNDLNDTGSFIINRHQLVSVIKNNRGSGVRIHHNRIVRARQGGIDIGHSSETSHNEIVVHSQSTNSYGVSAYGIDGFTIHSNTVRGTGEHPIGIGMVSKTLNGKVYGNRIEVQNTEGSTEYGATGSAGLRMTWGTDKVEVWNNHVTVKAQANLIGAGLDSWGRGLWVGLPDPKANVLFRNNTIIAKNNDGRAKAAGIAVVCANESPGLVFRDNVVVSNWGNVVLADDYGKGDGYAQFFGNVFRQEDGHENYRTIKSDYSGYISTGVFINNRYEGGASPDSMDGQFGSSELKDIAFGWEYGLNVKSGGRGVSGASVKIFDNTGTEIFSGSTDESGRIDAVLIEYWATNNDQSPAPEALTKDAFGTYGNRLDKNPYRVRVTSGGATKEQSVTIKGNINAEVEL